MINKTINLRKEPINGFMPTMTTYVQYDSLYNQNSTKAPRKRGAVVICPGGGYAFCSPREAEPIALQFCAAGFQAFVVDYCVEPAKYPESLRDVSEAVKLVRTNADEWDVDPDKIAVCGFSAGGHLAASLATLWNSEEAIKCKNEENKPNAAVLCYPVLIWGDKAHKGSFYNLMGKDLSDEEYNRLSLEKRITADTPQTFLWHTFEDGAVPVENSLKFAEELRRNDIPFEMHIYPFGCHGLSLATPEVGDTDDPHVASWIRMACEWLKTVFK